MTMTNTFREHLQRAIFETFDLWDIWSEWWENMTWPTKDSKNDKDKDSDNGKYILGTPSKSDLGDFWPLRHLIRGMRKHDMANKKTKTKTITMINTSRGRIQRAMKETWPNQQKDKDNNKEKWEHLYHYNHSDLKIKSDTGQYLPFLRCFSLL